MCLIFHREADGGRVDWELLRRGFLRNPHGAGVLYSSFGRWEMAKGANWDWRELREVLGDIDRFGSDWALHMRYRTKGEISDDNCHPFELGGGAWLMHNGTLPLICKGSESDSARLARRVRLGLCSVDDAAEMALRSQSRLLIAHPGGRVDLIGEWFRRSAGWFSNDRVMKRPGRPVVFS